MQERAMEMQEKKDKEEMKCSVIHHLIKEGKLLLSNARLLA